MRKQNLLIITLAAGLTLSACSEYDNDWDQKHLEYQKTFEDAFGKIDPQQDWNLAERAGVTVTTSRPSNVTIYAKRNGSYKIVGNYSEVSGTQTLYFDVLEEASDIIVSDGSTAVNTTVGGTVTLGNNATRTIPETDISSKVTDYLEISQDIYASWYDYVPEGKLNLGKVKQNFSYISQGPFTVYPIYWNTSGSNIIGIYYTDAMGTYHETDFYTIKSDNTEIQTAQYYWQEVSDADDERNALAYDPTEHGYTVVSGSSTPTSSKEMVKAVWTDYGQGYQLTQKAKVPGVSWNNTATGGTFPFYVETNSDGSFKSGPVAIRTQGIKLNIPKGQRFGMYLKTGSYQYYSESDKNKDPGIDYTYTVDDDGKMTCKKTQNNESKKAVHACTFESRGDLYFGFEDWDNTANSDFDLNDNMFLIGDPLPVVVENDADSWMICAEDLGNTGDIDYNDVVVEVSHVSGLPYASITPVAAGGMLGAYLYFNDTPIGEIHSFFGEDARESGTYSMLNTSEDVVSTKSTATVTVDKDFSLASSSVGGDTDISGLSAAMGGFSIRVVPAGEMTSLENATASTQVIKPNSISKGGTQNVPYVLCVPTQWSRTEGTQKTSGWFRWPSECTTISDVYKTSGHSFADWVSDSSNNDWYMYPDATGSYASSLSPSAPVVTTVSEDSGGDDAGGGDAGGSSGTTLTLEEIDNLSWTAHVYSVTGNSSLFKEGAVITIKGDSSFSYCDLCTDQWGAKWNYTTTGQGVKSPTVTLTSTHVSIVPSEGTFTFYICAYGGAVTSVTIE